MKVIPNLRAWRLGSSQKHIYPAHLVVTSFLWNQVHLFLSSANVWTGRGMATQYLEPTGKPINV